MKHITFHFIHYSYVSHLHLNSSRKETLASSPFPNLPGREHDLLFSFSFATTFSPLPSFWSKSMYISSLFFPTSLVWISQYRMVFPGYWNTSSGVTTFLPRHPLPFSNGTGSYPLKTPFLVISRGHPGWFGSANDPENLSSKDDDDARLSRGKEKRTTTRNDENGFLCALPQRARSDRRSD